MKNAWMLVALPLVLTACAGDDTADAELDTAAVDSGTMAPPPPPMDMGGMPTNVALASAGGSSVTGQATMTSSGGQTEVMVTLNGLEPNSSHPGHIHQGTCAAGPGAVAVPLTEITADSAGTGTMTVTVPLALDSVTAAPHLIAYHGEGGAPIVCGEVMAHAM